MNQTVLITCLVILGVLGAIATGGGIYLVATGAGAAEAMAIFGLGNTVVGAIAGVIVGKALPTADVKEA